MRAEEEILNERLTLFKLTTLFPQHPDKMTKDFFFSLIGPLALDSHICHDVLSITKPQRSVGLN